MEKGEPMKREILTMVATATSLAQIALGQPPPIMQYSGNSAAALEFISTATNHWGVDASGARSVFEGAYGVLRFALADYDQSALCGLFRVWAEAPIPPSADRDGTNVWLGVKCDGIRALAGSRAVCNDTNCWMSAAAVHGQIVAMDRHKWYEFIGLDASLIEEQTNGTVVINAPIEKRAALEGRPWMTIDTNGIVFVNAPPGAGLEPDGNEPARKFKASLGHCRQDVGHVLGVFASSETFVGMDFVARNTIVSNLVETARLTPSEAAALGLTNKVLNCGGETTP